MGKKEERKKAFKGFPKSRDTGKPNALSRNVPMSSQSKHDMWPQSVQRHHIAINAIKMESQKSRPTRGDPSYSLDRSGN